jgi:hypothetical protein
MLILKQQVSKIEVQYDKTSKQVDVQALKVTLWDHVQAYDKLPPVQVYQDLSISKLSIIVLTFLFPPPEMKLGGTYNFLHGVMLFQLLVRFQSIKAIYIFTLPLNDKF